MTGKGSGRRKENTELVRKNWDSIKWGVRDELKGDGDTFEEKVSLSDEMRLHGDKHKPEVK